MPLESAEIVGMLTEEDSIEGLGVIELFDVRTTGEARCFERNCVRWVFQGQEYAAADRESIADPRQGNARRMGLTHAEVKSRIGWYGDNAIRVPVPPISAALSTEIASWGIMYQMAAVTVQLFMQAYPVAALVSAFAIVGSGMKAYITRSNTARIAEMAVMHEKVEVVRDGDWVGDLPSTSLVPGDVVSIPDSILVPADIVLIEGIVVVDEAMLTGETMPVKKLPTLETSDLATRDRKYQKDHLLSAGTRVISASSSAMASSARELDRPVMGVVVATGGDTNRGELIREILRPKVVRASYHTEVPFLIAGLVAFGFVAFTVQFAMLDTGSAALSIIIGIYNVMQVINPLIPAALLIGESVACARLKEQGIFCLSPSLVVMAGQLRVFCFDKTGTLTKEGLQLLGVHEASISKGRVSFSGIADMAVGARYSLLEDFSGDQMSLLGAKTYPTITASPLMSVALATCHTVTKVNGKLIGNPSEVQMAERCGWTIDESTGRRIIRDDVTGNACSVLAQFEFDHHLMTQSVSSNMRVNILPFARARTNVSGNVYGSAKN
jgi:cation-transporting ATPase 13A3/4/5